MRCLIFLPILAMAATSRGVEPAVDKRNHEPREWTSAQGTPMTASLLRFKDREHIVLARDRGAELTVALDQLSQADRDYAARIWAMENPVVLFGRQLHYPPQCTDVAAAMGRKIVEPGHQPDAGRLYNESRSSRAFEYELLGGWIAKTPTAEPPVLLDSHWIWRLTDTRRRQHFARAVKDLPGAEGLETLRVILVDPVISPAGFRRMDGEGGMVPPEEMAGLVEAFRTEHVVPAQGLEIAPVRTVYHHVSKTVPEWRFHTNINMPTPLELERVVVMATVFHEKPPLLKLRELKSTRNEPLFPGLQFVPEAKLGTLEDFILEAITKANS